MDTDTIKKEENTNALSAPTPPSSLALVEAKTQGLLLRMFADPYLLVFYRWGNRSKMPVRELKNYSALVDRVMARPAVAKVMKDEGITLD